MSQQEQMPSQEQAVLELETPNPEVLPKASRRRFTTDYKIRMVEEVERCTEAGQVGALLRREGLYSSHISRWRKLRERWQAEGQSSSTPGRKPLPSASSELTQLRRENERLRAQLEQAEIIIDVQKKLSRLLGLTPTEGNQDGSVSCP